MKKDELIYVISCFTSTEADRIATEMLVPTKSYVFASLIFEDDRINALEEAREYKAIIFQGFFSKDEIDAFVMSGYEVEERGHNLLVATYVPDAPVNAEKVSKEVPRYLEKPFVVDEKKRTYCYPNGKVVLRDVVEIIPTKHNHRVTTADGHKHIIPEGWLHIDIVTDDDWTF